MCLGAIRFLPIETNLGLANFFFLLSSFPGIMKFIDSHAKQYVLSVKLLLLLLLFGARKFDYNEKLSPDQF